MKAIALTLTTLCLAAAVQSYWDYELQCARAEIGIRWPSYYSNSDYYICPREGGKQLTITCPPGEVFTFVLQTCTAANKFIPPPPLNVLPISRTSIDVEEPRPIEEIKPYFPKPIHTPDNDGALRPPVLISENSQDWEIPVPHPPVAIAEPPYPQVPVLPEQEIAEPPSDSVMPSLPGKPAASLEAKPDDDRVAPLPPTPPPTPPVVDVTEPPKKRLPPALPGSGKKLPSKQLGDAKKQPPRPQGKKVPPKPQGKQQPPKPAGKKQIPSFPAKA